MNKYSFAIIGHGYMAGRYIKCIDNNSRAAVKLIVHRRRTVRNDFARDSGASFASDDELCSFLRNQNNIDAIIICSPDHTHPEYVSRLLSCNKIILCEKPLARTEQEFQTLLHLSKIDGKNNVAVGMNCRFRSKIQYLKGLIEGGAFKGLKFVNASYFSNITPIIQGRLKTWWLEYPQGAIPFLHGGAIHLFDALRLLLGDVEEVLCIPASTKSSHNIGGESFIVVMRFTSDCIANITITGTSPGPNRFQISIESDNCAVDEENQYVLDPDAHSPRCVSLPVEDFKDLDRQLTHIIDILDGKANPINSIGEAYKNFRVIKACEESIVSKSWVRVNTAMSGTENNHG